MRSTQIIAIRHGQTAWNASARVQGHADIPLDALGLAQAKATGLALAGERLAALYSSDLSRAHGTALAAAAHHGLAVHTDTRLRERSFGQIEGSTFAQVQAERPQDAQAWRTREEAWAPQGGESLLALQERVVAVTHELAARHLEQTLVLVAHGGVLDVLHRAATRQSLQAPRTWALDNCAINRLLWSPDSGLMLVGWNDIQHLAGVASGDDTSV